MPTSDTARDAGAAFGEPAVLRPSLLLHSCCGPCSTAVCERLAPGFRITVYFCNSNIDDEAEYKRRLEAEQKFVRQYNASGKMIEPLGLVCAPYAPKAFLRLARGLEGCAEGGARCRACIADRLEKTAAFAALNGYGAFSTTLSVSRHKNYEMIRGIGKALALRYRLAFEGADFKKGGGEQRSIELSKAYGLYRQNYCGCRFSKAEAEARAGGGERNVAE
ncbi:MAG: epoxyqueuosine reductase QueH [Clostridiales Family XIII bacterium]|nr:epoxyqueuosine reductase QueH [Clostridiales Family XIII bacterium]